MRARDPKSPTLVLGSTVWRPTVGRRVVPPIKRLPPRIRSLLTNVSTSSSLCPSWSTMVD